LPNRVRSVWALKVKDTERNSHSVTSIFVSRASPCLRHFHTTRTISQPVPTVPSLKFHSKSMAKTRFERLKMLFLKNGASDLHLVISSVYLRSTFELFNNLYLLLKIHCMRSVHAACAYGPTLAWGGHSMVCPNRQTKQGGGGHQKFFPDIYQNNFSGHITKFPLTSRIFRENTKNFKFLPDRKTCPPGPYAYGSVSKHN
jgi:hypothetical protein